MLWNRETAVFHIGDIIADGLGIKRQWLNTDKGERTNRSSLDRIGLHFDAHYKERTGLDVYTYIYILRIGHTYNFLRSKPPFRGF